MTPCARCPGNARAGLYAQELTRRPLVAEEGRPPSPGPVVERYALCDACFVAFKRLFLGLAAAPQLEPGARREEPVFYLRRAPDPLLPWCQACPRGVLTVEPDPRGKGDMYVCTGGCGQRYWVDLD